MPKIDKVNIDCNIVDKWETFRQWVQQYKSDHTQTNNWDKFGRYCIAISCDEILEKMFDLDQEFD